tara:strand:- start:1163 stop:1528 length:366 start_codon:yes stop_codon:yes gene_type:complete
MSQEAEWRWDLKLGEEGESLVRRLLEGAHTVEVKRDFIAPTSGNLAIEYECRGKPSGIAVTEADWWAFVSGRGQADRVVILFETKHLKELCRRYYKNGSKTSGGDQGCSRMVLIPVCEILT